jgi:hypothetical protein
LRLNLVGVCFGFRYLLVFRRIVSSIKQTANRKGEKRRG